MLGGEARVRVERVRASATEWLLVVSYVAPEDALPPRDAMSWNMRLAPGALALDRGSLELRVFVEVAGTDVAALARTHPPRRPRGRAALSRARVARPCSGTKDDHKGRPKQTDPGVDPDAQESPGLSDAEIDDVMSFVPKRKK